VRAANTFGSKRFRRVKGLLRTQAFRILLIYLVLFAVSSAVLVGFSYLSTRSALNAETDQTIEAEITGLSEQYQQLGLRGLADVIVNRSVHAGQGLYLLTDAAKRPIVGNLDAWPQIVSSAGSFVEFDYERRFGGTLESRRARGRVFALTGGFQLLVARDVHERYESGKLFTTTLPWTIALMLLLGFLGGGIVSRNMLARLDEINRTSHEIMLGDLTRRVPVTTADDEFDTLASNLNRMLGRIERLMKGLREVTDSVAHDLRSPLNRLRNRLEAAQKQIEAEGRDTSDLENAIAEADHLIATFNALLLIAEAEAGVAREAMAPVSLAPIVEGVAELYGPVAEEKNIVLTAMPGHSAPIEGNRSLISQALANLVDNAIKYTPPGGRVIVRATESSSEIELSVADSGPGIPESDRGRVLERFVRLEASRNSPGTGLGLSLVAAVAQLHNAAFTLTDNAPGLKAALHFPIRRHIAAT
jgi:signal transduction histidine kinase